MTPLAPLDPASRCPLCGNDNGCAMAALHGGDTAADAVPECWCTRTVIAPGVLERVPPHLRREACICAHCARG